ncbi:MAG: zinc ribbon domain-containing protein [Planctomycetota bacterium]|nr:zinc ribbon domain-containing protein [Planctomycetota bacterium]
MRGAAKFLIAFGVAFVLRFASGLFLEGGWLRAPTLSPIERLPLTLGLPLLVAGVVVVGVHRLSPRRLFDNRVRRPISQWTLGLGAGLAAAVLAAAPMPWMHTLVSKAIATGLLSGVAVVVFTVLLPRRRPYACVHCGAVIGDHESTCPGCGAVGSRGEPARRSSAAA